MKDRLITSPGEKCLENIWLDRFRVTWIYIMNVVYSTDSLPFCFGQENKTLRIGYCRRGTTVCSLPCSRCLLALRGRTDIWHVTPCGIREDAKFGEGGFNYKWNFNAFNEFELRSSEKTQVWTGKRLKAPSTPYTCPQGHGLRLILRVLSNLQSPTQRWN